ncbi:homocysteine-responsive endoplasmic reticulum-resident ubiquitin-like domain member 2 protein [Galendromus occidentalis]|uniref:Homocysteine-responsive endoplasmic reticulum-resident ubiquitin-like domain member 2 protein n=1 Tax=Galendromus occidentalis TaxID=34638 RepID=A0AAJ6VX12_9ACAR|nr:homocysteine-responsive endoplasmic reticulum-resident ubiquitin-like domain member 2 protein [Galendromus occidentalis]
MAEAAPPADGNLVVVVRAPNQETQDFEVTCPETWNVLRLKEHLQEKYQGNPAPADQKLIYSGQLLEDEAVLREVLRHEGVSPSRHTVHLVCRSPKNAPETRRAPNVGASPNGNRSSPQTNQNETFSTEFSSYQSTSVEQPNGIRYRFPRIQCDFVSNSVSYSAHILAMQHMYAQYYQHLLLHHQAALSGRSTPSAASYVFNPRRFTTAAMGPEQLQYWQNAYIPLLNQQNFTLPEANNDNNNNNHNFNANNNLNNNNNANNNNNNNMDEDENIREWDDYIYLAARIIFLGMLVYFYSSVEKLILVSGLGLLFFFYQQIRAGLQDQANAVAANAGNAAAAAANNPPMGGDPAVNQPAAARDREDIDRLQAAMDGENAPPPAAGATTGATGAVAVAQQSPVAAAANLLRAFFVSLIP